MKKAEAEKKLLKKLWYIKHFQDTVATPVKNYFEIFKGDIDSRTLILGIFPDNYADIYITLNDMPRKPEHSLILNANDPTKPMSYGLLKFEGFKSVDIWLLDTYINPNPIPIDGGPGGGQQVHIDIILIDQSEDIDYYPYCNQVLKPI